MTISSIAHLRARIDFDDLQSDRSYGGSKAYGQSKLANLMFAFELDRRARAANLPLISVAAHPDVASTGFFAAIGLPRLIEAAASQIIRVVGQSSADGATPGLYAATMPGVQGGQYRGPDGFMEVRGSPARAKIASRALDRDAWRRLWLASEALTDVSYDFNGPRT